MTSLPPHVVAINGRTVLVMTAEGSPVSVGRVTVKPIDNDSRLSPVTITFETEAMRCELGVPSDKIDALAQSAAGDHLAYRLPPGDAFRFVDTTRRSELATDPIIETFPLPGPVIATTALPPQVAKTPTTVAAEKLQKTGAAVHKLIRDVAPPKPVARPADPGPERERR